MREIPWYVSFCVGIVAGLFILTVALVVGPKENRWYIQGREDGMKQSGYQKIEQPQEVWVRR